MGQVGGMEDEAFVEVEGDDDRLPFNHDPPVLYSYYYTFTNFVSSYGWFVVAGLVVLYILWRQLKPTLQAWQTTSQSYAHKKYDVAEVEKRQMAMEAHRQRLQEEHDRKAALHAEKQAEREEKKRQERLEDWERHQAGLGYRSKIKAEEDTAPAPAIPKKKTRLRDNDYSPLMGSDGGSSSGPSWRSRRGPAAGGG